MDSAARSPKTEEKKHISHKVADILRKYRVVLLIVLAIAVAAVIGLAIWTQVHGAAIRDSTARIEKIEDQLGLYQNEQDPAKKADLEKSLAASLDQVIARWPHLLAAQHAHALKARLAEEKKDWAGAEQEWLAAIDVLPNDYLAPIALQNAAVAAEEKGSPEKSAEYYKRLIDKYSASTVGIPHAYFALGRLAEANKDYAAALTSYEKIVASYPDDDWTKLAKDRILFLKSRGLAK
jgi:tetratricopeptide (TPR) repeat protein